MTPASASRSANDGLRGSQASAAADRVGIARRARIAGEQFEQRGERRAAADRRQDDRRRAALARRGR